MLLPVSWDWNQHLLWIKTKKYGDKGKKWIKMKHQVKNTLSEPLLICKISLFGAQGSSSSGIFKPGQFSFTKMLCDVPAPLQIPNSYHIPSDLFFFFFVIMGWNSALVFLSCCEEFSPSSLLFSTLEVSQFDSLLRSCSDPAPAQPGAPNIQNPKPHKVLSQLHSPK